MKKKLGLLLFLCFTVIYLLQVLFFEVNGDFYEGLISNLLIEIVGIYVTVYFVEKILDKHEDDKIWKRFNNLSHRKYKVFINKLAQNYVHSVTKKPPLLVINSSNIKDIVENIDSYIDSQFANKTVLVQKHNPIDWFNPIEEHWSYLKHIYLIKNQMQDEINLFLNSYITILPDEICDSIYKIHDILLLGVFVSPYDFGAELPPHNGIDINVNDFRASFKEMGGEIIKLLEYAEGELLKK